MSRLRRLVRSGAAAAIGFASARAAAQPGVPRDSLTLDEARSRAVATSPLLAAVRASAEAAVERARQELLLEAPELDLEVGTEGPFTRPEGNVTYTVPLRSSAKTRALRAMFDAATRRAATLVDLARARVSLEVARAFVGAAIGEERALLDADDSVALAALVDNVIRWREAGTATDLDVLRLESEASAAARRTVADRAAADAARVELASLLGSSPDSLPPLRFDRDDAVEDTTAIALTRALGAARISAAELDASRADASRDVARLYRWTDPRVGGSYGYQQGEHVIGAVVRLPLPARHGNSYAIAAADLDARAAGERLTDARRRAAAQVEEAIIRRRAALAQFALVSDDLARRRTAELLARRRLEEGGPYLQIWLDVRRDRLSLERQRLDLLDMVATGGATAATGDIAADTALDAEGQP